MLEKKQYQALTFLCTRSPRSDSIAAVAAYKVSPKTTKRHMKSAATDIRQKLADWIRPDEEDIEEVDEFIYNDNDPIVQDAKKNMEKREADDKNYPPEID